jgi:hypothetical protein
MKKELEELIRILAKEGKNDLVKEIVKAELRSMLYV